MGNANTIWDFLKSKGFNDYAASGIIANFDRESGLNPKNLQDSCQERIGADDETYTAFVDSGIYTKEQFSNDGAGYGLMQLTWHTRKRAMYEFAKSRGSSIGSLDMQLNFFYKELSESFPSLHAKLKNITSVRDAAIAVMLNYEAPADQSVAAQNNRANVAQIYYSRYTSGNAKEANKIMGYKRFTKGQAVQVSEHFYSTEFDCHGSGCCSETLVNEKLIEYVEQIRVHFDAPVNITSPYRCPTHNSRIGGAVGSRHSKGDAADIVVKGYSPRVVAQYAESIGILGIGLYETSADGHFVHIDTRDYRSFWYGQSEQPRTTFGTYKQSSGVSSSTAVSSGVNTILSMGSSGNAVKDLQEKLNRLGFNCGTADGVFGRMTGEAVRKFQNTVASLGVDGIAGYNTLTELNKAVEKIKNTSDGNQVRVTATELNVRSGAGTNYPVISRLKKGAVCELVEEKDGWGKIKTPDGWISDQYYEHI